MQGNMNIYQVLTMFAKQRTNEHNASHYYKVQTIGRYVTQVFFTVGFVAKISFRF